MEAMLKNHVDHPEKRQEANPAGNTSTGPASPCWMVRIAGLELAALGSAKPQVATSVHWFWSDELRDPSHSASPALGLQALAVASSFLHGSESKFRSSHLHGRHLTDKAIFLSPQSFLSAIFH